MKKSYQLDYKNQKGRTQKECTHFILKTLNESNL